MDRVGLKVELECHGTHQYKLYNNQECMKDCLSYCY